jgi:predicted heme/steroid binding protein
VPEFHDEEGRRVGVVRVTGVCSVRGEQGASAAGGKVDAVRPNVKSTKMLYAAIFFAAALSVFIFASSAFATPEYAERTGESCSTCHAGEEVGGELTEKGAEFAASGYTWPPQESHEALSPIRKPVRLVIGFIHILASFMWFGTILYVHIMLRPGYAARGLPRGEVVLGLSSMLLVGASGVLLTVSRVTGLDVLFSSQWGIVLSIKIALYVIMVSSALFTVIYVGPRLRKGTIKAEVPKDGVFGPASLSAFDGKSETPAYVAFDGKVYDVSGLELWNDGVHMKHMAGSDLTHALPRAPHGEEKLQPLRVVGAYDSSLALPKTFVQRAFYFVAYMNLALVFLVLLVIAYWRWGL